MAFPTIQIKALNVELAPGLEHLINQKLHVLERLLPTGETDMTCEVEIEKTAEHVQGKIYRIEVNLFVAGKMHRAEATEEQIEKAIDAVRDDLKNELQHAHGKRQSLVRRGGRMLKDMLRFGR